MVRDIPCGRTYVTVSLSFIAMKKIISIFIVALFCALSLAGCASKEIDMEVTYTMITAEQAKTIMDSDVDYIIIDARTEEEFAGGHIENAILIPEYEVAERAEQELPNKDQLILVYCRSGRRSKIAADELVKLGYTNVKEFGGIIDWPYETTTSSLQGNSN